jgi:hypothetical protein
MFPLGWKRGDEVEVELFGGNLKEPVKVKPDWGRGGESGWVEVGLPGRASLPFEFVAGERAEAVEPESEGQAGTKPLPPGTVMNGRISRPGEVDRYRLAVTSGQHWNFEINAATLGTSQLLGLLSVYNSANRERLALSDENAVDPHLGFTVPPGVKEVVVQVEDILGHGGPNHSYRLLAALEPPGFAIDLLDPLVNIPLNGSAAVEFRLERRGYDGPVHISMPDLPEDLVLNGGNVPAAPPVTERSNLPNYFTLTAKAGAKPRQFSLSVWGEAESPEGTLRKHARATGMTVPISGVKQNPFTAPWLSVTLPATIARPSPLGLEVSSQHIRLAQGSEFELSWKMLRPSSMKVPVKVERRQVVNVRQINFVKAPNDSKSLDQGSLFIKTTLATPPTTFDLVFDGTVDTDGRPERVVTAPAVTVEIVPLYNVKLTSQQRAWSPGDTLELTGLIEREPGFRQPVTMRLEGLPEHVTSNETLIPENSSKFRLLIEASREAKPQEFQTRLTSAALASAETKGNQPYSIPEVKIGLTLAGSGTAP